jgi:hypothetical protein
MIILTIVKIAIILIAIIFVWHIIDININPDIRDYKVLKFYEIKEFHLGLGNMPHDYVTYVDDNGMKVTEEFYQGNFMRYDSKINEPILRCRNGYCNLYIPNNYNYSNIQNVNEVYVVNP